MSRYHSPEAVTAPAVMQSTGGRSVAWSLWCCNPFFCIHFQLRGYLLNELGSGHLDLVSPLCLCFAASRGASNWCRSSGSPLQVVVPYSMCVLGTGSCSAVHQKAPGSHTNCSIDQAQVWYKEMVTCSLQNNAIALYKNANVNTS